MTPDGGFGFGLRRGRLALGGALSVDEWLIGQIDDVRFYDVPLDLAHVQALAADDVVHGTRFERGYADANGGVNITDGIFVLNFLFLGGPAPPDPHGACGWDPTPGSTTCDSFPPCL